MKSKYVLLSLLVLGASLASSCTFFSHWRHPHAAAASAAAGQLIEPADKDSAWLTKARADYPLKTCLVSGDELGGMGGAIDRIYRVPGQPDRLVRFCCDGCPDQFLKDPAKFLPQLVAPAQPSVEPHH